MDFIKKLQKKPESIRRNILYVTTFLLAGIIVLLWIVSFPSRFSSTSSSKEGSSLEEDLKPFYLLKESISEAYQGVSQGIGSRKKE